MRHPFFLSPACATLHEHSANSPKCLWLCIWGWEPWSEVSWSPAASWGCQLQAPGVAWKETWSPAKGWEQRGGNVGGRKCSCTWRPLEVLQGWYPELGLAFSKELLCSCCRSFLQVSSTSGCTIPMMGLHCPIFHIWVCNPSFACLGFDFSAPMGMSCIRTQRCSHYSSWFIWNEIHFSASQFFWVHLAVKRSQCLTFET